MNRTQWVLVVILAVQLALLGALALRSDDRGGGESRVLLPELDAFTPARIEIGQTGEGSVALVRIGEGWSLEEPADYPVAAEEVAELLDKLAALRVRRSVVSGNRYHGALKVTEDDHERRLRIWDSENDTPRVDLFVGTSPNFDVSHLRLSDDDRVYEARGLGSFDLRTEASAWIEREFVDVPLDDVVAVKLSNAHGEIELVREDGVWSSGAPERSDLDDSKVDGFIRSIGTLLLSEPATRLGDPALGLDDPIASMEIRRRTGGKAEIETLELRIGASAPGEEGRRFAARSGFGFAVVLGKYDVEKLTEKTLTDLLPDASDE